MKKGGTHLIIIVMARGRTFHPPCPGKILPVTLTNQPVIQFQPIEMDVPSMDHTMMMQTLRARAGLTDTGCWLIQSNERQQYTIRKSDAWHTSVLVIKQDHIHAIGMLGHDHHPPSSLGKCVPRTCIYARLCPQIVNPGQARGCGGVRQSTKLCMRY